MDCDIIMPIRLMLHLQSCVILLIVQNAYVVVSDDLMIFLSCLLNQIYILNFSLPFVTHSTPFLTEAKPTST
jgi:hypothetical protein